MCDATKFGTDKIVIKEMADCEKSANSREDKYVNLHIYDTERGKI